METVDNAGGKDSLPGSNTIVKNCFEELLKKLESSLDTFSPLVTVILEECMTAAETSLMETAQLQIELLPLTDELSPPAIQKALDDATVVAEEAVTKKLTSLEEEIQKDVKEYMSRFSSAVREKIRKSRDSKVAAILLGYSPCLEKAEEVYNLMLKASFSVDEYVPKEKLDKIHSSALAIAQIILTEKMNLEPTPEVRAFIVNRLNVTLMKEFLEFREANENVLESSQKMMGELEDKILTDFKRKRDDILATATTSPENAVHKMNNLHCETVKLLQEEFSQITSMVKSPGWPHFQKLLQKLQASAEEAICSLENIYPQRENSRKEFKAVISSIKVMAKETFFKEMQNFTDKFTVVNANEYKTKFEEVNRLFITTMETDSEWSPETVTEVASNVKDELTGLMEKFWTETISEKNRRGEDRIREEITILTKMLQDQVSLISDPDVEILLEPTVTAFSKSFLCSSSEDQDRYVEELRRDLGKLLEAAKNSKLQQTREIELASEKLLQEFKDLASKNTFIHELHEKQLQKFAQITSNWSQQAHFAKELGQVLQDTLRQRHYRVQFKKMKTFVDNLIKKFLVSLDTKGADYASSKKSEFANFVEAEADTLHIDPNEFLQRLEDGIQLSLEACRNQTKQQLEEVIDEVLGSYKNEMRQHFEFPKYFSPKGLKDQHEKAAKSALAHCRSLADCSAELITLLQKELNQAFEEFNAKNAMNAKTSPAIGINLGTTNSCLAVYKKEVLVIPNSLGKPATPCYVHFSKTADTIVGEAAEVLGVTFLEETVFGIKRIIGRVPGDPDIPTDLSIKWPFKVLTDQGKLQVEIGDKAYSPEEVTTEILKRLKDYAEKYLKEKVTAAVLTVPAYFTEDQKSATKKAAEEAGLEVLEILTEPVAAAIAYNLHWKSGYRSLTGLLYHLGGETFSTSVFTASKGCVNVVSVGKDLDLGGLNFDKELMFHCITELKRDTGIDLIAEQHSEDPIKKKTFAGAMMRLNSTCEQYKILLGEQPFVTVSFDSILDGQSQKITISRKKLEDMIRKYINKSLEIVGKVLEEAGIAVDDIDHVVLTGGCTRIPLVQEKLRSFFGKDLNLTMEPDQVLAFGAAYEAAVLNGKKSQENKRRSSPGTDGAAKRFKQGPQQ